MKNPKRIKKMILDNRLPVSALSESALHLLIEYETECLMKSKAEYDTQFMDLCLDALETIQKTKTPSDERINELAEKAYQQYRPSSESKIHILPKRRPLRCLVITALILVLMLCAVAAGWHPIKLILNGRHLLDVQQGEIIEKDNMSFTSDLPQKFTSVSEMEEKLNLPMDILHKLSVSPQKLQYTVQGSFKQIMAEYHINGERILFVIHLENAPYREELIIQAGYPKQTLYDKEWYILDYRDEDNRIQFLSFDGDYVYTVSATDPETLRLFFE